MKWVQKKENDKPDKEDKETEAAEDGGERNQNQVTKVLCGWREEKHLKSIIFIFLSKDVTVISSQSHYLRGQAGGSPRSEHNGQRTMVTTFLHGKMEWIVSNSNEVEFRHYKHQASMKE